MAALPTIRTSYIGHTLFKPQIGPPVLAKRWKITEFTINPSMVDREFMVIKPNEVADANGRIVGSLEINEIGQKLLKIRKTTHLWREHTGGPVKISIEQRRMRDDSLHYWFSADAAEQLRVSSPQVGACLRPEEEGEGFFLKLLPHRPYNNMRQIERLDQEPPTLIFLSFDTKKIYIPQTIDRTSPAIKLVIERVGFGYKTTLS